jgi:hypothetical protein
MRLGDVPAMPFAAQALQLRVDESTCQFRRQARHLRVVGEFRIDAQASTLGIVGSSCDRFAARSRRVDQLQSSTPGTAMPAIAFGR